MPVNKFNGRVEGKTTISEIIEYLEEHQELYGDTIIEFMIEGNRNVTVQFDHYSNAITVDLEEFYEG